MSLKSAWVEIGDHWSAIVFSSKSTYLCKTQHTDYQDTAVCMHDGTEVGCTRDLCTRTTSTLKWQDEDETVTGPYKMGGWGNQWLILWHLHPSDRPLQDGRLWGLVINLWHLHPSDRTLQDGRLGEPVINLWHLHPSDRPLQNGRLWELVINLWHLHPSDNPLHDGRPLTGQCLLTWRPLTVGISQDSSDIEATNSRHITRLSSNMVATNSGYITGLFWHGDHWQWVYPEMVSSYMVAGHSEYITRQCLLTCWLVTVNISQGSVFLYGG